MKNIIWCIIQCSWGCVQTLLGFVLYLKHRKCRHYWFYGCYVSEWNWKFGISLGLFVFVPAVCKGKHEVLLHEYGHAVQSLYLGPFYIIPGFSSVVWAVCPLCIRFRKSHHISYHAFWTERWADELGLSYMEWNEK